MRGYAYCVLEIVRLSRQFDHQFFSEKNRRFFERRHISVEDELGSHVQEGLQISPPLSANSVSTTASEEDADFSSATDSSRTGPDGGNSSQSNGDPDNEVSISAATFVVNCAAS